MGSFPGACFGDVYSGLHLLPLTSVTPIAQQMARQLGVLPEAADAGGCNWKWCKEHRHEPLAQQHRKLSEKVRGHYAYYGIRGNSRSLARFRHEVGRLWCYWLNRRSRKKGGAERLWRVLNEHFRMPPARIMGAVNGLQLAWSL